MHTQWTLGLLGLVVAAGCARPPLECHDGSEWRTNTIKVEPGARLLGIVADRAVVAEGRKISFFGRDGTPSLTFSTDITAAAVVLGDEASWAVFGDNQMIVGDAAGPKDTRATAIPAPVVRPFPQEDVEPDSAAHWRAVSSRTLHTRYAAVKFNDDFSRLRVATDPITSSVGDQTIDSTVSSQDEQLICVTRGGKWSTFNLGEEPATWFGVLCSEWREYPELSSGSDEYRKGPFLYETVIRFDWAAGMAPFSVVPFSPTDLRYASRSSLRLKQLAQSVEGGPLKPENFVRDEDDALRVSTSACGFWAYDEDALYFTRDSAETFVRVATGDGSAGARWTFGDQSAARLVADTLSFVTR